MILTPAIQAELLDPANWHEVLEQYAKSMRLAVALSDQEGRLLGPCHNPQPVWTLTRNVRSPPVGTCSFCLSALPACTALAEALATGNIMLTVDRSGLAHVAVPLFLGEQRLGALLAGQVFVRFPEQLQIERMAREFQLTPGKLWPLAQRQIPLTAQTLQMYGELLASFGKSFLQAHFGALREKQRAAEVFALNEDLVERKRIAAALLESEQRYCRVSRGLEKLNKRLEERVSARTSQLRALASVLAETEQRERRRLAEVLHDHLQQLLVASRLRVGALHDVSPAVKAELAKISKFLQDAISIARSLTTELSPPVLSQEGIRPIVDWAAQCAQQQYGLICERTYIGPDLDISRDLKALLLQITRELLLNAIKHAQVKRIRIVVNSRHRGCLHVAIVDAGGGFNPAHGTEGERLSGFGLLNIRERLEWVGGRLKIVSKPGGGARVAFWLPVQTRALTDLRQTEQPAQRLAQVDPAGETASLSKIKVLLVDDHAVVREGLREIISADPDMRVVGEAMDGEQAVELSRTLHPDIVVMDVRMPQMSGIEATRIIKQEAPNIKIIGLSIDDHKSTTRSMRAAGACDHLNKEIATEKLREVIRAQVDRK